MDFLSNSWLRGLFLAKLMNGFGGPKDGEPRGSGSFHRWRSKCHRLGLFSRSTAALLCFLKIQSLRVAIEGGLRLGWRRFKVVNPHLANTSLNSVEIRPKMASLFSSLEIHKIATDLGRFSMRGGCHKGKRKAKKPWEARLPSKAARMAT